MPADLVHVGFDNYLTLERVLAVASPSSAPMKRMVQRGKEQHRAIDLTSGRRTKAVVVLDEDWVALIAITPETFAGRIAQMRQARGDGAS
jgi:extracellular matrix regulatory protein A